MLGQSSFQADMARTVATASANAWLPIPFVRHPMTARTQRSKVLRLVAAPRRPRFQVMHLEKVRVSAPGCTATIAIARQHCAAHSRRYGRSIALTRREHPGIAGDGFSLGF